MSVDSAWIARAEAAYLGLALGDALGATVEFLTPREIAKDFERMFFPGLRRVVGLGGPPFMGSPNPWNE